MRIFLPAVVVLCLVLSAPRVGVSEPARYTVDDCLRIGLDRNATVANARRDVDIAFFMRREAASDAFPQISGNASYTLLDEAQTVDFGGSSFEVSGDESKSAGVEVSQLVYSGGKVSGALRAARIAREYAGLQLAEVLGSVTRDIRVGFGNVLLARGVLEVREESRRVLAAMLAQTEEKRKGGAASEFDVLSARVRLANEEPVLIEARNALELAGESLRRLVNLDDSPFTAVGELALERIDTPLEELQRTATERRPLLVAMDRLVLLREQQVVVTASDALPSVKVRAGYVGSDAYGMGPSMGDWEWHWNAGAVLSWNIWDGNRTRSRVASVRTEVEKARTALEDARGNVKLEVRQAFLEAQRASLMVDSAAAAVTLAEKALSIARTRYDAGMATQLEYSEANLNLAVARLARCTALHGHVAAVARLKHACGMDGFRAKRGPK